MLYSSGTRSNTASLGNNLSLSSGFVLCPLIFVSNTELILAHVTVTEFVNVCVGLKSSCIAKLVITPLNLKYTSDVSNSCVVVL